MTTSHRIEIPSFQFPAPLRTWISRGVELLALPMKEATTVSISAHARRGKASEPIAGLATLTADMLTRGTRHRSEAAFAHAVDILGATHRASASMRTIGASIIGLPEHVTELIALLAESLLEPAFTDDEFKKVKLQTLSAFPLLLASSSYRAERLFRKLRFPNHPLSNPPQGTPSSIATIKCEDIRSWYHTIGNSQWRVIVVGAFDPDDVLPQLERYFSQLGATECDDDLPPFPSPPHSIGIGESLLREQVELRLGHEAPPYTNDQYAAAWLIATAFAGHFRSRVNMLLRENEGMTYGALGSIRAGKQAGTFSVATSTTPNNLARTINLLIAEWKRLAAEPFSDEEVYAARQYLYGTFWRSIETPDAIAAIALELALNDLPSDFYTALLARIERLTPIELLPVQQQFFDPSRLLIAAVGDTTHLEKVLSAHGTPQTIVLEEEQQ